MKARDSRASDNARDWRMAAGDGSRPSSVPSGAIAKPKRNDLSLKLKYEVIKVVQKEPKTQSQSAFETPASSQRILKWLNLQESPRSTILS